MEVLRAAVDEVVILADDHCGRHVVRGGHVHDHFRVIVEVELRDVDATRPVVFVRRKGGVRRAGDHRGVQLVAVEHEEARHVLPAAGMAEDGELVVDGRGGRGEHLADIVLVEVQQDPVFLGAEILVLEPGPAVIRLVGMVSVDESRRDHEHVGRVERPASIDSGQVADDPRERPDSVVRVVVAVPVAIMLARAVNQVQLGVVGIATVRTDVVNIEPKQNFDPRQAKDEAHRRRIGETILRVKEVTGGLVDDMGYLEVPELDRLSVRHGPGLEHGPDVVGNVGSRHRDRTGFAPIDAVRAVPGEVGVRMALDLEPDRLVGVGLGHCRVARPPHSQFGRAVRPPYEHILVAEHYAQACMRSRAVAGRQFKLRRHDEVLRANVERAMGRADPDLRCVIHTGPVVVDSGTVDGHVEPGVFGPSDAPSAPGVVHVLVHRASHVAGMPDRLRPRGHDRHRYLIHASGSQIHRGNRNLRTFHHWLRDFQNTGETARARKSPSRREDLCHIRVAAGQRNGLLNGSIPDSHRTVHRRRCTAYVVAIHFNGYLGHRWPSQREDHEQDAQQVDSAVAYVANH